MENGSRKASDVLLEMEAKMNVLLSLVRTQDLNIKVLSNKLNNLLDKMDTQQAPKITAETANTHTNMFAQAHMAQSLSEKESFINNESALEVDNSPIGFRRSSRPETYSGDKLLKKETQLQMPVKAEVIVPSNENKIPPPNLPKQMMNNIVQNAIPVQQRVVDKNGKSVFLAEIEILDMSNGTSFNKTKTNGTGKWAMALPIGNYRVFLRKREGLNKEKIEIIQDISVDGSSSPMDLPMMIIK